jgi:hypothetical protein
MLQRQIIRERTVALLTGRTAAGPRVYPTPILPWRRERPLPAIGVYTLNEGSAALGTSGPYQFRQTLDVMIEVLTECVMPASATAEERLFFDVAAPVDALCEEIEAVLLDTPDWYLAAPDPVTGHRDILFETATRWPTRIELGRVEDTDRRTAAATITAPVVFTCIHEPAIPDRYERMHVDVDMIDPGADPNTTGHPTTPPNGYPGGYPGPDGRIELTLDLPRPTDPPFWPPTSEEEG